MWGRSVYGLQASFVGYYKFGRSRNLTPTGAARFAVTVIEARKNAPEALDSVRRGLDFSAEDYKNSQDAFHEIMKEVNLLEGPPLPSRGSRKSVNWAPQFNHPENVKKPITNKRSSSRISSQASAIAKRKNDRTLLEKMSNKHARPTEESPDQELPVRIVSYLSDRRRQRQRGPKQPKNPQNPSKGISDSRSRKRPRPTVGEDKGQKHSIDEDHDFDKRLRKRWVAVPLNDMEDADNSRRNNFAGACPEGKQPFVRFSENEAVKSEDVDRKVAISDISGMWQECKKLLKKKVEGEIDDMLALDELHEMVTGAKGFISELEHVVVNMREVMVEKIRAEKAECEATTAAERQKLRDEIKLLKKNNRTAVAEKLRIQRQRDKLQRDYVGAVERTRNSVRLEFDKENAEAATTLRTELAKEQDKSSCQICFTAPRDAIVLPCMHFQYCNECLQKHQRRSKDCPTCRGMMNGVLRCNLGTN